MCMHPATSRDGIESGPNGLAKLANGGASREWAKSQFVIDRDRFCDDELRAAAAHRFASAEGAAGDRDVI